MLFTMVYILSDGTEQIEFHIFFCVLWSINDRIPPSKIIYLSGAKTYAARIAKRIYKIKIHFNTHAHYI